MQTNKRIPNDSELHRRGQALIKAAYDYWQQYQQDVGRNAVVWIEDTSGHFVLFTRGEYKNQVIAAATRECATAPVMFEPFEEKEKERKDEGWRVTAIP